MRILFISQTFPYPLDTGTRNHIYHWLEASCRVHDIHLLVITEEKIVQQSIPGLPRLTLHLCPIRVSRSLLDRALRQAACLVHGIPATSFVLISHEIQNRMMDLLNQNHYDLIILAENVVAGFAPLLRSLAPVLLVKHSVYATDARDLRLRNGRYHPRWVLEEQVGRRFEAQTCRAATVVCCVTRQDAVQLILRYGLSNPVEPIPVGVDMTQFPCRSNDPATKVIGFFGNLTWGANVDAVRWFCREVLPRVWRSHPDARFLVAGPGSERLRPLSEDGRVQFVGRVPSIPEAMKEVSVGVAPVISGTGIRFKLLEMLSMGIPAVSTSLGAEGTGCVDGQHLLIADGADAFARSVDILLCDATLRQRLASSGAKVASAYSWVSVYPKVLDLLDLALHRHLQTTQKNIT